MPENHRFSSNLLSSKVPMGIQASGLSTLKLLMRARSLGAGLLTRSPPAVGTIRGAVGRPPHNRRTGKLKVDRPLVRTVALHPSDLLPYWKLQLSKPNWSSVKLVLYLYFQAELQNVACVAFVSTTV